MASKCPKTAHPRSSKSLLKKFSKKDQNHCSSLSKDTQISTQPPNKRIAVVAIDFGTTYSGYAYAFTSDPNNIHVMGHRLCGHRREGYGMQQPTVLLLTSEGHFHSFGYEAQEYYHDLDEYDAVNWLYFEKFKMELHSRKHLHEGMQLVAANGVRFPAVLVFAHSLNYFKHLCVQEIRDQMVSDSVTADDIQWVITVPAIWRESARQFMRRAATEADLITSNDQSQLTIALEPEAASIYCQTLKLKEHILPAIKFPHSESSLSNNKGTSHCSSSSLSLSSSSSGNYSGSSIPDSPDAHRHSKRAAKLHPGVKYLVADCGGGTVDLTLHQVEEDGRLKELYKASGGAWGSIGVDYHFEMLLVSVFGQAFIEQFIRLYPISWLELMNSFEAKKRYFDPSRRCASNVSLPFSFVESFRRTRRKTAEQAICGYGDRSIQWSSQGNLRLLPEAMTRLFQPVIESIIKHINKVIAHPSIGEIDYIFLVGGFSESPALQEAIHTQFSSLFQVIIPQDVSLCTLKGAVMYGLNTSKIRVRHAAMTYGVACLHRYNPKIHPPHKKVIKEGKEWCTGIFDTFVSANQPISTGQNISRCYNPASSGLLSTIITLLASENENNQFITDPGVTKIAELKLDMPDTSRGRSRELKVTMDFSNTEVTVTALDCTSGQTATARIDFLYKQQ